MKKYLMLSPLVVGLVLTGASCGQKTTTSTTNTAPTNSTVIVTDQNEAVPTAIALVGTWQSDCLVPDGKSAWSEKHQFVIKSDGTASYTRWSAYNHVCSPADTATRNYTYTFPAAGQINLTDLEEGATIYDLYQITDQMLKFGHGFQAHYPAGYDATQGGTAANRFHVLNDYIVYTKQ